MSKTKENAFKALEKIFTPVKKVEAASFLKKGNLLFQPSMSHLIVVDTPQGPMAVNSCSKNYELIPNRDLITPLIEKLSDDHDIELKVKHRDYSKFYVDVLFKDGKQKLQKDDIFPRIRLINSYDGSIRYSFSTGFYRLVCENGMAVPIEDSAETKFKMMHTITAGNERAILKTQNAIEEFLERSPKLMQGFTPLMKKQIAFEAAVAKMQEIAEEIDLYPKKLIEEATARLQVEKGLGYQINDYLIYNAMNYALMNADTQMKEHKRDNIDREVLNYLMNQ